MREQELVESTENELAEQSLSWVRKSRFLQTLRELVSVRLAKFGLVVLGIAVIAARVFRRFCRCMTLSR